MVHGRIFHIEKGSAQAKKNIQNLGKVESLVFMCLRKMSDGKEYSMFSEIDIKEKFLNDLLN